MLKKKAIIPADLMVGYALQHNTFSYKKAWTVVKLTFFIVSCTIKTQKGFWNQSFRIG